MLFVQSRWLRPLILHVTLLVLFATFFISSNIVSKSLLLILIAFIIYESYIETLVALAFITPKSKT